jgi:hypothetical protein
MFSLIYGRQIQKMSIFTKSERVIVELLYGTQEGGKRKENDRVSSISKYIKSVQVEVIRICIENC